MKCVICQYGETQPGKATVSLTKDEMIVVFKEVPAHICENCGEEYVEESVQEKLFELMNDAERQGIKIDIRVYQAA